MKIKNIIFISVLSLLFLPFSSLAIYIEDVSVTNSEEVDSMVKAQNKVGQTDEAPQVQVQAQIQVQAQEQNQVHEVGTGIENPELKEMNQEQNELQINKTEDKKVLQEQNQNSKSLERRSEVANAVQAMLKVSNRNEGIGEQIREIAQNQNQIQNNIENSLEKLQNRNKFLRFLVGPNYKELKEIERNVENQKEKIEGLNNLKDLISEEDKELIEENLTEIKTVIDDVEKEIIVNKKVFSLFGWFTKIFLK